MSYYSNKQVVKKKRKKKKKINLVITKKSNLEIKIPDTTNLIHINQHFEDKKIR